MLNWQQHRKTLPDPTEHCNLVSSNLVFSVIITVAGEVETLC